VLLIKNYITFQKKSDMKKSLLMVLAIIFTTIAVNAQQDTTLAQYTGKYIFQAGAPVPDATVSVSGTNMSVSSAMGTATLVKIEGDLFSLVEYSGTAEFKRNETGKVTSVIIKVGDTEIVGTKETPAIYWMRPHLLFKM
jgi:hypothetical protein